MQERQRAQLSRFYVSDQLLNSHGVYQLSTEDSKHLMKVLRLGVGDIVELVDGSGRLQKGQVSTASKSSAVVCVCPQPLPTVLPQTTSMVRSQCSAQHCRRSELLLQISAIEQVVCVPWSGPRLDVVAACGSLKGGRSDWLIEKATELGAFSVIPLLTANSPQLGGSTAAKSAKARSNDEDQQSGRLARWQRVATAGMKQSLRTHQLKITQPWHADDLISCIDDGAQALIGAEGGGDVLKALRAIYPLPQVRSLLHLQTRRCPHTPPQ